jgi:hypothetical protein
MHDAMVSAGALVVLLTLLVGVDGRVREQVTLRMTSTRARADVAAAGTEVRDLVGVVVDVVDDAMRLHTTLTLFVVVATMLTVFMVRT